MVCEIGLQRYIDKKIRVCGKDSNPFDKSFSYDKDRSMAWIFIKRKS